MTLPLVTLTHHQDEYDRDDDIPNPVRAPAPAASGDAAAAGAIPVTLQKPAKDSGTNIIWQLEIFSGAALLWSHTAPDLDEFDEDEFVGVSEEDKPAKPALKILGSALP